MLEPGDLGEAARVERANTAVQRRDLRRFIVRWRFISSAALVLACGSLVVSVILWRHAAIERYKLGDRVCREVNETRDLTAEALMAAEPHEKNLLLKAADVLKHRCSPDNIERP